MNKKQIIDKLKKSNLDLNQVIIISGASLVLQDVIKFTNDIDISTSKEYYDIINWNVKKGAFDIDIKYYDVFEISFNLYYPNNIITIDGIKCLSLEKCLEIKEKLNRDKDKEVIKLIKDRLNKIN